MKGLYNLFRWFNLFLILVTFLAYLSPFINPESFSWINIVGIAYPWLLLANVLFLIFWAVVKNRYFLFSLCCILLGWNHLTSFIGLSLGSSTPTEHSINVMSFNTSGMRLLADKNAEQQQQNIAEFNHFLKKDGLPDILCVQEISSYRAQNVMKGLKFPYSHKIPYRGTSILSNFPIIKSGEIEFTTKTNSCLWADIKIKNQTVRFYSLHLKSNQVSTETEQILAKGGMQEKEAWDNIKGIFGKFRYMSKIRVQQAQKVRAHLEQSPHPVILCGDFNETPQSYIYRLLSSGLNDTFQQKGFGFGTTYAGKIPALRIDYILSHPSLNIIDCEVLKPDYSDHYPVKAILELK